MSQHLQMQEDGTALLSMETLANIPVPIRIVIDEEVWDVVGWVSGREAIRLQRPRIKYAFASESAQADGTWSLEWVPKEPREGARLLRRVTREKRVRLEHELNVDRHYTIEEIDQLLAE